MEDRVTEVLNPGRFLYDDPSSANQTNNWTFSFRASKKAIDTASAIVGLGFACVFGIVLLILNPWFNPGPLLFKQRRMGMWGKPFTMWKFRTMFECTGREERGPTAPLEEDRITPLGRFLRRSRIDELPNFLSVLTNDMSLVGPRPDLWDHAQWFSANIPFYKYRVRVRPGITGLAQIRGGYADQLISINRKARYDYYYIRHSSARMDLYILLRTFSVMIFGTGAK